MLFVLTGPEATAKSSLAVALAAHFGVPGVAEAARAYLTGPRYAPSDLLRIADLQIAAEAEAVARSTAARRPTAFADTDLQVIYVWWQERFGPAPTTLYRAYQKQSPRHYLLCEPDIPWMPDPLRENPDDRDRLFALYEADLRNRHLRYTRVSGSGDQRLQCAIDAVGRALLS